jgi:hypothetical protein
MLRLPKHDEQNLKTVELLPQKKPAKAPLFQMYSKSAGYFASSFGQPCGAGPVLTLYFPPYALPPRVFDD